MKITIEGKRFDTEKADHHWELNKWDGSNRHTGDLYVSSAKTWYVYTPSQWANRHYWRLITPEEALDLYSEYLSQEELEEVSKVAKLDWE